MKFRCEQNLLNRALSIVSRAVPARTTMPVLSGIHIEADREGEVILSSSDLKISIQKHLYADVEEEGEAVISARLLSDIVRKLPKEIMTIESTSGPSEKVSIRAGGSEFSLLCLDSSDFPDISTGMDDAGCRAFAFDRDTFRDMIEGTSFAASTDESRGVLTGILTEVEKDSITMVALDGYRLAEVSRSIDSGSSGRFIISARTMNEISRIMSEEDSDMVLASLTDRKAVFSIGGTMVILQIMEGEFISYRDIIPSDNNIELLVDRKDFLESIERASLLASGGKNNLVRIIVEGGNMIIRSSSEMGEVREAMTVGNMTGGSIEIGFNSKYVMDALKNIDDDRFVMTLKNSVSSCVIKSEEGEGYRYLILPVRIPSA